MVILEAEREADHRVQGHAVRVVGPGHHRHGGAGREGPRPGAGHQRHGALVNVPRGKRNVAKIFIF